MMVVTGFFWLHFVWLNTVFPQLIRPFKATRRRNLGLEMALCVVAVIARLCKHAVRDGQSGPEGAEQMARLRALASAASIASMAFTVGWALPASAGTSTGASAYSEPTWWQKFLTVSAPGFQPPPSPGKTGSVSVGSNIDMSNEPTPQSQTSTPTHPPTPRPIASPPTTTY